MQRGDRRRRVLATFVVLAGLVAAVSGCGVSSAPPVTHAQFQESAARTCSEARGDGARIAGALRHVSTDATSRAARTRAPRLLEHMIGVYGGVLTRLRELAVPPDQAVGLRRFYTRFSRYLRLMDDEAQALRAHDLTGVAVARSRMEATAGKLADYGRRHRLRACLPPTIPTGLRARVFGASISGVLSGREYRLLVGFGTRVDAIGADASPDRAIGDLGAACAAVGRGRTALIQAVHSECVGFVHLVRPFLLFSDRTRALQCIDAEIHGDVRCGQALLQELATGAGALVATAPVANRLAAERHLPIACRAAVGIAPSDVREYQQLLGDIDALKAAAQSKQPAAVVGPAQRLQVSLAAIFNGGSGSGSAAADLAVCPHS
jgi:hypothetical protein